MPTPSRSPYPRPRGRTAAWLTSVLGAALLVLGGTTATASAGETPSGTPEDTTTRSASTHPGAPGNNGTVKVGDETDLDEERPENDPHLPCTFDVQWYGYDSGWGPLTAEVAFSLQAPTDEAAGVAMTLESGNTSPTFTGNGGQPGAGDGRDHLEWYTLAFTGEPHPQQGYHVRVTVDTPHSKGSTTKSKVFWVGPCDDEQPVTAPGAGGETTGTSTPVTETPGEVATSPAAAIASSTPASPSDSATTVPSAGSESPSATVLGAESVAPSPGASGSSAAVLGAEAQARPAVAVPRAVAAGEAGIVDVAGVRLGPVGLALVGLGLALLTVGGAAVLRHRRGSHQY